MPIFEKDPYKSVSQLQRRLDQGMALTIGPMYESRLADPMVEVFKEMRNDLERTKRELTGAILREKKVVSRYQRLVKHVHAFYSAAHNKDADLSKLQLVAKSTKDLNSSISGFNLPPDDHRNQQTGAYFQMPPENFWKMSNEWRELLVEEQIHNSSATALENLRKSYDRLDNLQTKLCLLCLSIFPDNRVLKKRLLIYWWISEGIITAQSYGNKTAEEVGDEIFDELIREGLIVAAKDDPSCPIVNRCSMNPWIRDMLVSVAREAFLFDFDPSGAPSDTFAKSRRSCLVSGHQNFSSSLSSSSSTSSHGLKEEELLSVFNVSEEILAFNIDWLSKLKKIEVLQLGRWQYWCEHHIEVENDHIFKSLGSQKLLKYLSLRGISRISFLPASLSGLVNLEILDLKACHNLEILPDISSLKRLTHLDLSECYLLESMPKGIPKLTSLQVLKGFVIGNSARNTSKLSDLAKLKKLRRLSIYLGRNAVVLNDECDALKEIESLRCLTITWGPKTRNKSKQETKEALTFPLLLPDTLKKLDLRGFPLDKAPEWLKPSALRMLETLYIRGGQLNNLEFGKNESWGVQILRLKFMRNFGMGLSQLKKAFPHLQYLEKIECHGPAKGEESCDDKNIIWSKGEDEKHERCDQDQDHVVLTEGAATEEGEITSVP